MHISRSNAQKMRVNQMLRKEKEMNEADTERFLVESEVGRLGVCDNNKPYVVPVLFVYDKESGTIFVHCAKKGKKIDIMKTNPNVCFETDEKSGIIFGKSSCSFSLIYRSVIAFGEATFIDDPEEKAKALNLLIKKYAGETKAGFVTPEKTASTQVIGIRITSKTGKQKKKD